MVSEELGLFSLSQDEIDEALNHKRGVALTGVHTAREKNYLLGVFSLPT